MNIQSINTNSILNGISIGNSNIEENSSTSFSTVLSDAINKVNDSEVNANNKIEALIKELREVLEDNNKKQMVQVFQMC